MISMAFEFPERPDTPVKSVLISDIRLLLFLLLFYGYSFN
jgi:hypothetical protein